jgi:hypothetical protein
MKLTHTTWIAIPPRVDDVTSSIPLQNGVEPEAEHWPTASSL